MVKSTYFYALGRRKRATARIRLQSGKGNIVINNKPAEEYLAGSTYLMDELNKPFATIEKHDFDVSAVVTGGGQAGQIQAIRLGIAKALVELNLELKGTLKRADLLGRDPREKERKKYGFKKARKQRQFTKR